MTKFKLTATRNDCASTPSSPALGSPPSHGADLVALSALPADVHAFLGWFDCAFRSCHKPVSFSTGPHAKYTHWKRAFPSLLAR